MRNENFKKESQKLLNVAKPLYDTAKKKVDTNTELMQRIFNNVLDSISILVTEYDNTIKFEDAFRYLNPQVQEYLNLT